MIMKRRREREGLGLGFLRSPPLHYHYALLFAIKASLTVVSTKLTVLSSPWGHKCCVHRVASCNNIINTSEH